MRKFWIFSFIISVITVSLSSCSESDVVEETDVLATESQVTTDEAIVQSIYDGIDQQVGSAFSSNPGGREAQDPCLTIIPDFQNSTIVLDFGDEPCEGIDGITRQGKINISFANGESFEGFSTISTITFDDFFIDGYKVEGARVIENLGYDGLSKVLDQKITLTNGKVTLPDGGVITHEAEWLKSWDIINGIHTVTGSSSGVTSKDISYESVITSPLISKRECFVDNYFYPVEGVKTTTAKKNNFTSTRGVDFGDGTCDNIITVTIDGGDPIEITL